MIAHSLKGITAFGTGFVGAMIAQVQDKTTLSSMDLSDWAVSLGIAAGIGLLTWLVPNYNYSPPQR
jgi:hypothetical protein